MKMFRNTVVCASVLALVSCAATQTALQHGTLEVSTKQSDTIFLKPVSASQKTIYISVKNTSDEDLNIAPKLKSSLINHGYKVVNNADSAHYLLQANVLKVGKMSPSASKSALGSGYGSVIAGAVAGTALGSLTHSQNMMIGGGLAGAALGVAADALIKDENYTMVTDVQISERAGAGVKINEKTRAQLSNGSATQTVQTYSTQGQYERYRFRVVSNANKMNLKFSQAKEALEDGLVKSLSGNF